MPPKRISTSACTSNRVQKRKPQGASGALHDDSGSDVDHLPAVPRLSETPLSAISLTGKGGSTKSVRTPRGASGAIHIDSDDDCHIETSLHIDSSSQRAITSYQAFTTKRQRTGDPEATQAVPAIDLDKQPKPTIETPEEVKKRKQGASVMMKIFAFHLNKLQDAILERCHDPDIGKNCSCGASIALFRCQECFDPEPSCQPCLLKAHMQQPFHRVQEWTGSHFVRRDLGELGHTLFLGHRARRCPNTREKSEGRLTTIIHTNGIHTRRILYCHCNDDSEAIQLVRSGLFPATIHQPETVFTFAVLKDFHLHTLTSKKSAYDHYHALQKHTNNAFPQKCPDRFRPFVYVGRVWRHLAASRRAGQAHGIDTILTLRRPGSLVVRCPACPEIGVNIDEETLASASPNEKHKYMIILSQDGNFKAIRLQTTKEDPDDVSLSDGKGIFVSNAEFLEYLSKVGDSPDKSTCTRLKAVQMQNITRYKNAVITGVVAVQCARHGFFIRMVDLQKGERYANSDYALASALQEMKLLRWIFNSYDIECQYSVNRVARFTEWFPDVADIAKRITGCIPKAHLRNHKDDCQYRYSFNYTEGVGCTCGETIETTWSEENQVAGSTKHQNDGHRHDNLDDYNNYWNWEKSTKMSQSLYRQYTNRLPLLKKASHDFDALCARHGPTLVSGWEAMKTEPVYEDGRWVSVFCSKYVNKSPPTQGRVYQQLCEQEYIAELAGSTESGASQFVNTGLRIEAEQLRMKTLAQIKDKSESEERSLIAGRVKLRRDITKWRQYQHQHYPQLYDHISPTTAPMPEDDALLLPSALTPELRARYNLTNLASIEYSLREGQAHDALVKVRDAIKDYNCNLTYKRSFVHGQDPKTRAQHFLQSLAKSKVTAADKYRNARHALLALGLSPDDRTFQPLHNSELWMKGISEPHVFGGSSIADPWFWTVGRPSGLSEQENSEWSLEVERVKWFRDRATRDRFKEEKEILEAEFERTIKNRARLADAWSQLATRHAGERPGAAAYASQQRSMYALLGEDCQVLYKRAQTKAEEYGFGVGDGVLEN